MSAFASETGQLGFDALLSSAEADNRVRRIERETAHLPGTMAEAIPYFRVLLRQHHAAMLAGNIDETMRLREAERRRARHSGRTRGAGMYARTRDVRCTGPGATVGPVRLLYR